MKNCIKNLFLVLALVAGVHPACILAQTNWTQLSPTGGPPQARSSQTAVLNTSNGRMIIFGGGIGGNGPGGEENDVWIFHDVRTNAGSTWQQLTVSGTPPSKRLGQSAVYDQVNNRMIIFGGDPNVGYCFVDVNDVWVLTNADGSAGTAGWTQLSPSGTPPPIRSFHSAVYDQTNNRMIIYGGNEQCDGPDGDLWVLTNANGLGGTPGWTQLSPTGGGPGARTDHSAVYDAANNRMILFGGLTSSTTTNDTWVLSNANGLGGTPAWTQLTPSGTLPPPRYNFNATYDPAMNSMLVFGGSSITGSTNDVWVLSNANGLGGASAWTRLIPTGTLPSIRYANSCVEIPGANRIIIFGGYGNGGFLNDVWALQYVNPAPTLGIGTLGNQTALYWLASATNVVLQTTTNLSSPNWTTVSNGTPIAGVILTNNSPSAFFRLQSQ